MKLKIVFPMVVFASVVAAADVPSAQVQIAGAVLAAPAELREGAAVLGYDAQGGRVQIREGKNELICLATDPTKTAFNVACYHKDLEPFMSRGRELLASTKGDWGKAQRDPLQGSGGRQAPHAEGAANALCPDRNKLRQRNRESPGPVPALGDLRAFRYAAIHRVVHQSER